MHMQYVHVPLNEHARVGIRADPQPQTTSTVHTRRAHRELLRVVGAVVSGEDLESIKFSCVHARLKESVEAKSRDDHADVEARGPRGSRRQVLGGAHVAVVREACVDACGHKRKHSCQLVSMPAVAGSGIQVGQGVVAMGGRAPRE